MPLLISEMAREIRAPGRPKNSKEVVVRVGAQGRIVLPRGLCLRLGLVAGSELEVHETKQGLLLTPELDRAELLKEMRLRLKARGVTVAGLVRERRREARLEQEEL